MTNVTVSTSGGITNGGVYSYSAGTVIKNNHSVISGTTNTLYDGSGVATRVGNTQLDGGAVDNVGTLTCVGVYNGNYVALGTNCQWFSEWRVGPRTSLPCCDRKRDGDG